MSKIIDIDREKEMKKGREGNSDTKKEANNVFIERIKTRLNNNRVRGKKKDKKRERNIFLTIFYRPRMPQIKAKEFNLRKQRVMIRSNNLKSCRSVKEGKPLSTRGHGFESLSLSCTFSAMCPCAGLLQNCTMTSFPNSSFENKA